MMSRVLARAPSDLSVVSEGFSEHISLVLHASSAMHDDNVLVAEGFSDTIKNHLDAIMVQSVRMSKRMRSQNQHIRRLQVIKSEQTQANRRAQATAASSSQEK